MKCPNCESAVTEKQRWCPNCGVKNPNFKADDDSSELRTRLEAAENEIKELKASRTKKTDDGVI